MRGLARWRAVVSRGAVLRYSRRVRSLHFGNGTTVTLTLEQEWFLEASGRIMRDHGTLQPVPNSDEHQLRVLLEETASGLICTFCASPRPRWHYPVVSFEVLPDSFVLPGQWLDVGPTEWLACDFCAGLIARTARDALARRSTECRRPIPAVARDAALEESTEALIRYIQDAFWRSRCGGARRLPNRVWRPAV